MENQELNRKKQYLLRKQEKEKERMSRVRNQKIRRVVILSLPILLIFGGIYAWLNVLPKGTPATNISDQGKPKITVFYSPTCDCCREYLTYLKRNGFEVEEKKTQDMLSIKEKYQIPPDLEACHTSVIGDYFVEGHIPVEVIKKVLEEKPEISGIALPGMPAGSPGMGGFKIAPFKIYALFKGQSSEFLSF